MSRSAVERDALIRVAAGLPPEAMERKIILSILKQAREVIDEATFKSLVDDWRADMVANLPAKVSIFEDSVDLVEVRFEIGMGQPKTSILYKAYIEMLFQHLDGGSVRISAGIHFPNWIPSAQIALKKSHKNPILTDAFVSSDLRQLRDMARVLIKDIQDALARLDLHLTSEAEAVFVPLLKVVRSDAAKSIRGRVIKEIHLAGSRNARIFIMVPNTPINVAVYMAQESVDSITLDCNIAGLSAGQIKEFLKSPLVGSTVKDPGLGLIVKFKSFTDPNHDAKPSQKVMAVIESWFEMIKKTIGA